MTTVADAAANAGSFLQRLEAEVAAAVHNINDAFIVFLGKFKTGLQIVEADVDAAIKQIASHIGIIDNGLRSVETWLPQIASAATAAGAPPQTMNAVMAALADAKQVVLGLDAVAKTANSAGATDLNAIAAGIGAVTQAHSAYSNLIANLALVQTPVQAQVVSPNGPSATA